MQCLINNNAYITASLYVSGYDEFKAFKKLLCSQEFERFKVFLSCVAMSGRKCPKLIVLPGPHSSDSNESIVLFNKEMCSKFTSEENLKNVLQLFADYECAGKSFFEHILRIYNNDLYDASDVLG